MHRFSLLVLALLCCLIPAPASAQELPPPPELPGEQDEGAPEPDPLALPEAERSENQPAAQVTEPGTDAEHTEVAATEASSDPSDGHATASSTTRERPRELGLNPGTPRTPVGLAAGAGDESIGATLEPGWNFQFHGYLAAPLNVSFSTVEEPAPGQSSLALHTPPQTSDTWGAFEYSNVLPGPWVQLNFAYGNELVTANVIVAAFSISSASAWFNAGSQLGINNAFLTFDLPSTKRWRFLWHVGAFPNRYGHMAVYDNGRYETPLIASTSGVGETLTAEYHGDDFQLQLEQGFQGHMEIAPESIRGSSFTGSTPVSSQGVTAGSGLCPADPPRTVEEQVAAEQDAQLLGPAYNWPDCNAGTSFVHHLHAGFGWQNRLHLTLHWLHAFSMDDRTPQLPAVQRDPEPSIPARAQPSGSIDVYGADLRYSGQEWGDLYLGLNHTKLVDALTVGNVISVLNAGGGAGISRFYLGPQSFGNGSLTAIGTQYDLSLGKLLRHPQPFWGEGPDLLLSLFGIFANVSSPDPTADGINRLKLGGEATYNILSWLGIQGRFDQISPNLDDSDLSRQIATARLIAKTEWVARERVWLQYSHYFNGDGVVDPFENLPPRDEDLIALVATMWW